MRAKALAEAAPARGARAPVQPGPELQAGPDHQGSHGTGGLQGGLMPPSPTQPAQRALDGWVGLSHGFPNSKDHACGINSTFKD